MKTGTSIFADYVVLFDQIPTFQTSITATQLDFGTIYTFVVQSHNSFGLSEYSTPLPLICATFPAKPNAPITENLKSDIVVTWYAPSARGMPITSYQVYFRKSDLSFGLLTASCNGGNAAIMTALKCTVPLLSLRTGIFNLAQENTVVVNVVATNFYGDS
jgi:hypothetical protein